MSQARVLFCGDRNWADAHKIANELRALRKQYSDLAICHGAARGADMLAGNLAVSMGIPVAAFPANWKRYGKRAGPIRNLQMLEEFAPTMVLAFHDNLDASRGTKHMVEIARASGIPTFVFKHRSRVSQEPPK